eukprot:09677_5
MWFLGNMLCVFVKGVLDVCDGSRREPVKTALRRRNSALRAPARCVRRVTSGSTTREAACETSSKCMPLLAISYSRLV